MTLDTEKLRKDVLLDITELNKITGDVPDEAFEYLKTMDLSGCESMKVHEVSDMCIMLSKIK